MYVLSGSAHDDMLRNVNVVPRYEVTGPGARGFVDGYTPLGKSWFKKLRKLRLPKKVRKWQPGKTVAKVAPFAAIALPFLAPAVMGLKKLVPSKAMTAAKFVQNTAATLAKQQAQAHAAEQAQMQAAIAQPVSSTRAAGVPSVGGGLLSMPVLVFAGLAVVLLASRRK